MRLTTEQRNWCESLLGQPMRIGTDDHFRNRVIGTVVDYKVDIAGIGVFFVLQTASDNFMEAYRTFPKGLGKPPIRRLRYRRK